MINEKLAFTKAILENNPKARTDNGVGHFLNDVAQKLYPQTPLDFTKFKTETWERARRKVLELNPELDERTKRTVNAEMQVRREVA